MRVEALITEIEVKNFKTLRDVKIPLAPGITVMVGANNSGKSNALAVLKLLAEAERQENLEDAVAALGGLDSLHTRGARTPLRILVNSKFTGEGFRYLLQIERGHRDPSLWTVDRAYVEADSSKVLEPPSIPKGSIELSLYLMGTTALDLSVAALRAPAVVQQDAKLGPDGRDVAAVLDVLAGENPSLRDAIDETVGRAAPEVRRVVTRPGTTPGTKSLGVEERDGRVYGAEDMSDGLLLFIGLATAAHVNASTPGILVIEEPERGIHPRRIRDLVDHLLGLTKSGVQVVLTTHSPTLLDEFRDTPESVLIFDRDEQGTHITRLSDRPDWAEQLQGAPLGELWFSGVLGGVPGR